MTSGPTAPLDKVSRSEVGELQMGAPCGSHHLRALSLSLSPALLPPELFVHVAVQLLMGGRGGSVTGCAK